MHQESSLCTTSLIEVAPQLWSGLIEDTFDNLKLWLETVDRFVANDDVRRIIVGNKCDEIRKRVVSYTDGKVPIFREPA